MTVPEVRAVLLDADGVVQANPPGWLTDLEAAAGDGRGAQFVEELFAAEQPAMTGECDFREVLRGVVDRFRLRVDAEDLLAHWRQVDVSAETLAVVGKLRAAGVGCYLVSNQNAYRADYMRHSLGYDDAFDGQFYSCELGTTKSSSRFFRRVLVALRLPAREVLVLDDSQKYVDVAAEAGLRAERWSVDQGVPALRKLLADHGLPG